MRKLILAFLCLAIFLAVAYHKFVQAAGEIVGIYTDLRISSRLVQDVINYNNGYLENLPGMGLEEIKRMQADRLRLENKLLSQIKIVVETLESYSQIGEK